MPDFSLNIHKYKAIIFDLDGTLYDAHRLVFWITFCDILSFKYFKAERYVKKSLMGRDYGNFKEYDKAFGALFGKLMGMSPEISRMWYHKFYTKHMVKVLQKHFSLRPQVQQIFTHLQKKGIKVAVFSDYCMVEERLEALGFDFGGSGIPNVMTSAEERGALKPAPRPFGEIASELGVEPSQVLVVGDDEKSDGAGAKLSWMDFLQIRTKKQDHSLMSWETFSSLILNDLS